MSIKNVISTLNQDGTEVMGPGVLMYHYPANDIMNGSLLTVENNHFAVLKSRGAILNVYETGQYPVETPQRVLLGNIQQQFYGGQSPWQYEVLFVSRAKSVAKAQGVALSRELAELVYDVDYYVHVDTAQDAVRLVTHMPYSGPEGSRCSARTRSGTGCAAWRCKSCSSSTGRWWLRLTPWPRCSPGRPTSRASRCPR
jgi:hypothetical protein